MIPISMPHTTRSLAAPIDWDSTKNGKCIDLPISDHDGVMYSYWKPTFRQRLQILFGRPIRLSVCGVFHPPVALDTDI